MKIKTLLTAVFVSLLLLPLLRGQTVSRYAAADAVVMEAHPDSVINQSNLNGNILAYKHRDGENMYAVYSYVQFDISNLKGTQVEAASFSYRGKTGDADFEEEFLIELHSLKSGFDAETLSWNNQPGRDKKLGTSALNSSSARKEFVNEGTHFIEYINEAARKGETTIAFLIRSAAKDSTSNMWIGGAENGNYGPVLSYTISAGKSKYAVDDAVAMEAHPDSVINQANLNGNLLAYRAPSEDGLQRVESYVKFDLSGLKGQQVESASFSYRGKTGDADFEEAFLIELFSLKADFDSETLSWNSKPGRDKKLGTSALNSSSARKEVVNEGTRLVDYINEEIRKGAQSIGFLIRSAAKDSTTNMWIGGMANGNYGPVLEYNLAPAKSCYGLGDAIVLQAYPDSIFNQSNVNGNILAYRESTEAGLQRVQSYVAFDISSLETEVENIEFSYRGKTGDTDFEEAFELQLFSIKGDFNADSLTWNNKPDRDKNLATSVLNSSSARKSFVNIDTRITEYINEALRKGETTVGFMIRSAAKDSTSNMWIGGVENGNYGPQLDISVPSLFKVANDTITVIEDVFVSQAEPDTNFEIEDADMHVIRDDANSASKEVYLKFPISGVKNGIGTASLMLRGAQKDPPTQDEDFRIQIFGTDSDEWSESGVTWNTKPEVTTSALANYNITESAIHIVQGEDLTAYVNAAAEAGRAFLTFVVRGRDETNFRAWISSKNWVPAQLALDYSTQETKVIEDGFVKEAEPDTNFDGVTAMEVAMDSTANNDRETYLKFDLAGARSNVVTATLILKADQQRDATVLDDFYIKVFGVNDSSWDETTLNWNNKPAADSELMEFNIQESADHELSSNALTEYVKKAIREQKGTISFAVKAKDDTPGSFVWISDKGWRPAKLFLDYRQIVADPIFITPVGDYVPEATIELAVQTPGAQIYYTLDGSEPTESSTLYEGPFAITDTATVRARAYADGLAPSDIIEATYNVAPVGVPVFTPTPLVEYNDAVTVTIDVQPEDAFIFYSDDGSDPLTPYPDGGILLTETTTLRARGVSADGSFLGPIIEATFNIVATVPGTGTGPGGVGAPDNTIAGQPEHSLWLKADALDANDGDEISIWEDLSGNGNDAYNSYVENGNNSIPNTGESQKPAPTYIADGLNGKPVLQFGLPDGSEQINRSLIIDDADNLDGGAGISIFMVFKRNQFFDDFAAVFQKRNVTAGAAGQAYVLEFNGGADPHKMQFVIERQVFLRNDMEFNDQDYYIVNTELQGDFQDVIFRNNGLVEKLASYNGIIPAVDAPVIIAGFQPMNIAELALYKKGLNAAQNVIVHNYLATKYGLPIENQLYSDTEYTEDLIGVGKAHYIDNVTEQEHRSASGAGLQIDARSQFNVGDFVLAAHNGAGVDDALNWNRYWNVEITGNAPNVNLGFDFEAVGMDIPTSVADLNLYHNDGNGWSDLELEASLSEGKAFFSVDALQAGLYTIGTTEPGTVAVKEIDQSENLTVYPNPVQDEVTLRLENAMYGDVTIQIFDYMGRLITQQQVGKRTAILQQNLSTAQLTDGLYTVKVLQNGKYRAIQKIVKQ